MHEVDRKYIEEIMRLEADEDHSIGGYSYDISGEAESSSASQEDIEASEEDVDSKILEDIGDQQETSNAPGVMRVIFEDSDRDRVSIEEEFTHFITEVYEPRKEEYLEEVEEIYGGFEEFSNIKATKGNHVKIKEIADKLLDARERLFTDIFDMMENPRFKFPKVEGEGEKYWYTTRMNNPFGFKVMKTSFYAEADQVREDLAQEEPEENEYVPRELGDKINNETTREEADLITEDHLDMREYFKSLSECLPNGGITDIESKLREILKRFSEEHPESGDAREAVKAEIEELTEVIKECIEAVGGAPGDEESSRIKSIDKEDNGIAKILEFVKDEAKWPMPTDYEYRGLIYKKYTFLNIDAMTKREEPQEEGTDYLSDEDLETDIGELIVPDPESVEVDTSSAEEDYNSGVVEQESLKVSEVPIDTMEYWQRYLGIATVVGLPFLATGLIVPSATPYILLPCIYIPIKVFSISKAGLVIVLALAIRGVCINIMLIVLNMNQQHNSLLFPVTILLSDIVDNYYNKIKKIADMVPMIANGIMAPLKSNNIALLKENKKYKAEMTGLKALKIPGKNEIIRDIKKELKQDTRMMVNRLESDIDSIAKAGDKAVKEAKETGKAIGDKVSEGYTDFADGFNKLMNKKKDNKDNKEETA